MADDVETTKPLPWHIIVPWLLVLGLSVFVYYMFSTMQVTCHYAGDLMSPAAKTLVKAAEKSKAGIQTDEASDEITEEAPNKKRREPEPSPKITPSSPSPGLGSPVPIIHDERLKQ